MKNFIIQKIGYSSGIYGCTGEYFICTYQKNNALNTFNFVGLYGSEYRISEEIKSKGYTENYPCTSTTYGKITGKDKNFYMSEAKAIDYININL